MLNYMNQSVDPCESFYDFACGGFMLKTLPDDQTQISSFSILNDELDLILTGILTLKPTHHKLFVIFKILFSNY